MTPIAFGKMKVGLLTDHPNHGMEYGADQYAVMKALALGYAPKDIKKAHYHLRQSIYENPGKHLSTKVLDTHPSHRQRHLAISRFLRGYEKASKSP
ncbi:MAG: hypothetical protein ACKO37_02310 [Vampirovibrionales bacterium]